MATVADCEQPPDGAERVRKLPRIPIWAVESSVRRLGPPMSQGRKTAPSTSLFFSLDVVDFEFRRELASG